MTIRKLRNALRVTLQAFSEEHATVKKLREQEEATSSRFDDLVDILSKAADKNKSLETEVIMLRKLNVSIFDAESFSQENSPGSTKAAASKPWAVDLPPSTPTDAKGLRQQLCDARARCHYCSFQLRAVTNALRDCEKEKEILMGQLQRQRGVIQQLYSRMDLSGGDLGENLESSERPNSVEESDIQNSTADEDPKRKNAGKESPPPNGPELEDSINQLHKHLESVEDPNWKWETGIDKATGRLFWINHMDQTTQWEPPPHFSQSAASTTSHATATNGKKP